MVKSSCAFWFPVTCATGNPVYASRKHLVLVFYLTFRMFLPIRLQMWRLIENWKINSKLRKRVFTIWFLCGTARRRWKAVRYYEKNLTRFNKVSLDTGFLQQWQLFHIYRYFLQLISNSENVNFKTPILYQPTNRHFWSCMQKHTKRQVKYNFIWCVYIWCLSPLFVCYLLNYFLFSVRYRQGLGQLCIQVRAVERPGLLEG